MIRLVEIAHADIAQLMTEHKGVLLAATAILGLLAGSEEQQPQSVR